MSDSIKPLLAALALLLLPTVAMAQTHQLIAFAGDSIVNGTSSTTAANSLVGRLLCSRPYWWIDNVSGNGASMTGASGVTALATSPANTTPNWAVVFIGLDDWAFNAVESTFKTDYTNYINNLEFVIGSNVICVTPIWDHREGTNNSQGYTIATLRADITTICTGKSLNVIDGLTLVPNNAAYFTDGTHPNDNGYAAYATNLSAALGAIIP